MTGFELFGLVRCVVEYLRLMNVDNNRDHDQGSTALPQWGRAWRLQFGESDRMTQRGSTTTLDPPGDLGSCHFVTSEHLHILYMLMQ